MRRTRPVDAHPRIGQAQGFLAVPAVSARGSEASDSELGAAAGRAMLAALEHP